LVALFYRGAGPGTYWALNDARLTGFVAQRPGATPNVSRLISHIRIGTTTSPYVSLSRSFGVAREYALSGTAGIAGPSNPGHVYEIELTDPLPGGLEILDPIQEIARTLNSPLASPTYHHDGDQGFVLGVIDPNNYSNFLTATIQTPLHGATARSANLSEQLEALLRALRDAEILAVGNIPATCVVDRHDVS
jgi:hypothetical protein